MQILNVKGYWGEELTEHNEDMEYEYWRLVRSYLQIIVWDMYKNKGKDEIN